MKRAKRNLVKGRRKRPRAKPKLKDTVISRTIKKEAADIDEAKNGSDMFEFNSDHEIDVKTESVSEEEHEPLSLVEVTEMIPLEYEDNKLNLTTVANGNKKDMPYKCTVCSKYFTTKSNLTTHKRGHTRDRPFKCDYCDATFVRVCSLHRHAIVHINKTPFCCDVCDMSFSSGKLLKTHKESHTGKTPFECNKCGLGFEEREDLNHHLEVHAKARSFTCDVCGRTFKTKPAMRQHIMLHDTSNIKSVHCKFCEKKFTSEQNLTQHIRVVHEGQRTKKCKVCGKSFKGNIDGHMRLHSDLREFACSVCGALFIQKSQLTVHTRTHTGERPYSCQVCGMTFSHTTVCRIHMRCHTGEKPFQCMLCSAAFKQLPHLKKHMKCVHKSSKPYICGLCDDDFASRDELQNHETTVHKLDKTRDITEENVLANLRKYLAILIYRIGSEDRLDELAYGNRLIDDVLKDLLKSFNQTPVEDETLSSLEELRKNVMVLLEWRVPKETMKEYKEEGRTLADMLDRLIS